MKLNITPPTPYLNTENMLYMIDHLMNIIANNMETDGLFTPEEEEWLGAVSVMMETLDNENL